MDRWVGIDFGEGALLNRGGWGMWCFKSTHPAGVSTVLPCPWEIAGSAVAVGEVDVMQYNHELYRVDRVEMEHSDDGKNWSFFDSGDLEVQMEEEELFWEKVPGELLFSHLEFL